MATHFSHALPIIIKNARFTLPFTSFGTSGLPADLGGTKTYEVGKDGASLAACAETATNDIATSGASPTYGGGYYITLTGAETNCTLIKFRARGTSAPASNVGATVVLRGNVWDLPIISTGTLTGNGNGTTTIRLGTVLPYDLKGCFIRTTGGSGGGGTGGANNQARMITAYDASNGDVTVSPAFETTTSSTTTYDILLSPLSTNAVRVAQVALSTQGKADVNAEVVDAVATDVIADSVPSDGNRPSMAQALYMLTQLLTERSVSGTTVTVKKPDGSTTLFTMNLDSATAPTSTTRAT